MKADAFVDWDWLASETVLKLAPAEPDAVDVEVPAVADVPIQCKLPYSGEFFYAFLSGLGL